MHKMVDERLHQSLDALQRGQSKIFEHLARVETTLEPLPAKIDVMEEKVQELAVEFAKINGIPMANQKKLASIWKYIGIVGGVGVVSGGIGSILFQLAIRSMVP